MLDRPDRRLLQRLLDEPALARRVRSLAPPALAKLIVDIGLEDAGEIVALASSEQLVDVFDEDLWSSVAPGIDETFDPHRFVTWLEVLLEAGPVAAARSVAAMSETLLSMALSELLYVIDFDALVVEMSGAGLDTDLTDKALDASEYIELGSYMVVWRGAFGWDAVVTLLAELHQSHEELLQRLLTSSCAASSERIIAEGGLYEALTQDESLVSDAAAERGDRRAARGYLAPSDATSFLRLARATPLDDIIASGRDPVVRAYFRELEQLPLAVEASASPDPLAALPAPADATPSEVAPLHRALAALRLADPDGYALRMEELAFLLNVVVAGCGIGDRRVRSGEAAEAVLALCGVGLAHLAGSDPPAADEAVAKHGADKLFRIGWHLLADATADVEPWSVLPASTMQLLASLRSA